MVPLFMGPGGGVEGHASGLVGDAMDLHMIAHVCRLDCLSIAERGKKKGRDIEKGGQCDKGIV